MMALQQAAKILNSKLQGENAEYMSVSTDTRSLEKGDLYIALHGDSFDGHNYIEQAQLAGAVGAVVHKDVVTNLPLIKVEDTRKALGDLAAAKRQGFAGKVVAITGSNGKTTVKEMLASILLKQGDVLATQGNFNNDIGLPLTLLRLQNETYAVIEMGANHAGEIENLTAITQPDIALINNAAQAHLEGFGSVKGVAQAKGEIYSGLSTAGVAIVNADDDYAEYWLELVKDKKVIDFSMRNKSAKVYGEWNQTQSGGDLVVIIDNKKLKINLKVHGLHNAMNALASISAAQALDIEDEHIVNALNNFTAVKGRLNFHKISKVLTIVDDTYNANPASLSVGLTVLKELPGKHWLVLGDMGELGSDAQRIHFDVGMKARTSGVEKLLTIGEASEYAAQAFGENSIKFKNKDELVSFIKQHQSEELGILIKGSRFMQLEQVVESLIKGST